MNTLFGDHRVLLECSRISLLRPADPAERSLALDVYILALCGSAAALLASLEWKLRLPGHAILQGVPLVALGMGFAPRRGAGAAMGLASAATFAALAIVGISKGLPGQLSTILIGPLLDLALLAAARPWHLYVAFGLAGLGANLVAFAISLADRLTTTTGGGGGGRSLPEWLATAAWTYPLFGLTAGVVSAALLIAWTPCLLPDSERPRDP